ncbi:MAG TPA: tetratricopeptide repeat protein [Croceibacterium sp.]
MPHFAWRRRLALALALSLPAIGSPALAQQTAASASEAEARYRELAPQAATRAGDPAFDYALGIAALDSGRFGEAIIALQRVLAMQPDNAEARAELARAYALAGDIDTAREQFATVVDDPSLPDPVRQRFTGFVRQFDQQIAGGGSDVSGFVDGRFGYDSNINAATDLTTVTIPLFSFLGPGALGPGARETDDEFYEIAGGVSGVTAVGRQDRLFGSLLGNWRDNIDTGPFDTGSLTATGGYAHTFANRDVISLSAQAQQFWLGSDPYRTSFGAIAQYTRLLSGGRALTFSGQYNRFDYDGQPLLDADRFALAVGYVTRVMSASLSGGREETLEAAGDAYSNSFVTASAGAEFPLSERFALVGGAAFDIRRYDAPDALFLTERNDERLDVQAGLKIQLVGSLFVQPRVSYTRNWSNIPLYDYDRWTASAGLRFEF